MAYSQQSRYREIAAGQKQKYEALIQAQNLKEIKESQKAAETTVRLKAGETVFDLLEKGHTRKTKSIMAQDFFKDAKFTPSGETDAVNLFTKKSAADFPGSSMLVGETVQVNPSAYESLGRQLAEVNPGHAFKIPGADVDKAGNVLDVGGKMDKSVWHQKIGEQYASEISDVHGAFTRTGRPLPSEVSNIPSLDMNLTDEAMESATSLVGAETKLAKELGTWGTVGKVLGPAGVLYGLGTGLHQAFTADDVDDRVAGAATAAGSGMVGAGMLASAGLIGGVSTGGAIAGAAGGATLAGVGVSNFWNPVGWGIGIGAGLYGIGKGTGLF